MTTRRAKTAWYSQSRRAQERWKATTDALPVAARAMGETWVQGGREPKLVGPFLICLPLSHAAENLVPQVRAEAIERFARHNIEWHHGTPGPDGEPWPSTHLLDSQVQCVNVMLSLASGPDRGLAFAQAAAPNVTGLVEVEDGSTVAFEWAGLQDHLGERRGRPLLRGRFCTSVDAFLVGTRPDGGRTGILVEWKFTESYDRPVPFRGRGGTDRREVYRERYEAADSPFAVRPNIDAYFHEPHYQLMRLVLLADAMVNAGEFGMDRAVVVHAVPSGNEALLTTVPEGLSELGARIPQVWSKLVGGGRVGWRWVDTTEWLGVTGELAGRYGGLTPIAVPTRQPK